jgi:hypothetical protein
MSAGALSQAGPALLFMSLLVASILVGVCVLAFAARCVLAVIQETASGQDEIVWPDEPYVDWLGHAVLFLELLGIWLVPSALTARLLREVWLPENGALRVLLLAGPGLWLFFPIGLLSSLSALSRWTPFRWAIVLRLVRVAPAALVVYFLTAILLCAAVVPWYYALFRGRGYLLPVAAGVAAFVLFVYARLLGRLAFMIQRLRSTERTSAQAKARKEKPPHSEKKRKPRGDVQDPWAIPEEEERKHKSKKRFPWAEEPSPEKPGYHIPSAEDIEGYGIAADKTNAPEPPTEKPPRSRFAMSPEEYEPIEVQGESEPQAPPETQSELFGQQVRQHMAERIHVRHKLPPHPFIKGVYTFPFYRACFPYALALSIAFLVVGVLVNQLMEFGRDLFGW